MARAAAGDQVGSPQSFLGEWCFHGRILRGINSFLLLAAAETPQENFIQRIFARATLAVAGN
jgi:hypothetical protein